MFGFEKKKVQLRSVEDFLRTQEAVAGGPTPKPPKRPSSLPRVKALLGPILGVLFILGLVAAALSQFNGLRSEMDALKDQKSEDVKELTLRLTDLSARLDKSEKQATQLAENVSKLEKALAAETSERIRAEEAAKRMAIAAAGRTKNGARKTKPLSAEKKR